MSGRGFSAIVPAAGKGSRIAKRLGSKVAKPFLEIGGIPILARTLSLLDQVPEVNEILVATAPSNRGCVLAMAKKFGIRKLRRVIAGGRTRSDSVFNALKVVRPGNPYVLIHDGVRPFIFPGTVRKAVRRFKARPDSALVVARPAVPTLKEVRQGRITKTLDRSVIWEIETPQIFKKKTLLRAYRYFYEHRLKATDDASLAEMIGVPVRVFPCEEDNMKVTTVEDLEKARKRFDSGEIRIGTGEDRHRLETGKALFLGGVRIPSEKGALAHSDGDVILHALVDALLGALGLGDIGEFFPDTDSKFKGVRSERFLRETMEKVRERGFKVVNADTTVILEAPKLSPWKEKIRRNLAGLLGLEPDAVGVKAKTAEGLGPEGEGLSVAAHVAVSLRRKS